MLDPLSAPTETRPSIQLTNRPQGTRQIVLVFQGGGALGAYQAGVYQALHEARIEPDWIIGTSIGAINASLIAGNEPADRLDRLEEFWRRMRRKEFWGLSAWPGVNDTVGYWSTVLGGIPGFFEPNPRAFLGPHFHLGAEQVGFYKTGRRRWPTSSIFRSSPVASRASRSEPRMSAPARCAISTVARQRSQPTM